MDRSDVPPFEQIVADYSAFIARTLSQLGVRAVELDDVTQEVLCGVHRGLALFDPPPELDPSTALRSWLFGICRHQANAQHRRSARLGVELLSEDAELDAQPSATASAEDVIHEAEQVALLDRLLRLLDPHRRLVLVGYDVHELAMAEVAAVLGIPVNTAWNRRRLGLDDLRAAWRRVAGAGGRRSR